MSSAGPRSTFMRTSRNEAGPGGAGECVASAPVQPLPRRARPWPIWPSITCWPLRAAAPDGREPGSARLTDDDECRRLRARMVWHPTFDRASALRVSPFRLLGPPDPAAPVRGRVGLEARPTAASPGGNARPHGRGRRHIRRSAAAGEPACGHTIPPRGTVSEITCREATAPPATIVSFVIAMA